MAPRILPAISRVVTGSYRYLLCGAAIEAILLALLAVGDLGPQIPLLWSLLLPAFAFYGVAALGRVPAPRSRHRAPLPGDHAVV